MVSWDCGATAWLARSAASGVEERIALREPGLGDRHEDGWLLKRKVVSGAAETGVRRKVIAPQRVEEAGEANNAVALAGQKADRRTAGRGRVLVGESKTVPSEGGEVGSVGLTVAVGVSAIRLATSAV